MRIESIPARTEHCRCQRPGQTTTGNDYIRMPHSYLLTKANGQQEHRSKNVISRQGLAAAIA
jgi:hypothetical protein